MIKLYGLIMDSRLNPLSHISDTSVRHLVMQILAWMWCIVFSTWMGSVYVFGVSAIVHAILLAGIFITERRFRFLWRCGSCKPFSRHKRSMRL